MNKLKKYSYIKINTKDELVKRLQMPLEFLEETAKYIDIHWDKIVKTKKKKTGEIKSRDIYDGSYKLREIHNSIKKNILDRYDFPEEFVGGLKKRNLILNATPHVSKRYVGSFDIEKFFPSIKPKQISQAFRREGCTPQVADLLTKLVSVQDHVPQGFATSTHVALLTLLPVNSELKKLFSKHGFVYTLWIDDLNISGKNDIYPIVPEIKTVFKKHGFKIHGLENPDKATIKKFTERQKVTNVIVNKKPNISKEDFKNLRNTIYICKKYTIRGYRLKYKPMGDNGRLMTHTNFVSHINGKLSYAFSINRERVKKIKESWEELIKT
ncbi:MAG TPA: reverse transcriptase family protein [Candidatus Paceibacterota bacterium]|nr:reverse transcriptase family protein [Candidatus Paceibacterota bacterium]